ncbi:MAG TPA: class I SAM-dependent methyltransferase [Thiobacillaceae bacterium]|nr:class I SAM-dependent methyltransferase [Thiobacillaceae bacterium]HNF88201.1 class I SAM-dependent methyltransferase [Thiobacillaceae bacterium]HNH88392.1 class I SAM-dependent methyltransferase [Thiobacillaceae bacterium]HNI07446.1 class I SAM-dependent methyltransferase [Thiobacillaceae bacterium]
MDMQSLPPTPEQFETPVCPLCGGREVEPFIEAEDDLGGRPGRFRFQRCRACGLAYQSPRLAFKYIGRYYDEEYIAHRKKTDWGLFTPLYDWAMGKHDMDKLALVRRYCRLDVDRRVLDIGCGAGTFLARVARETGSQVHGVDFKDLSGLPWMANVAFHHGTLAQQDFGTTRFDLITMWHFLEHDYTPLDTLVRARSLLAPGGRLVIEVPRLDSLSFRLFQERWPGLQAPQHTLLFDSRTFPAMMEKAGLKVLHQLPYGAFPAYFYLFCGVAFKWLRGRGLNLARAIYPYFAGQLLLAPVLLFERRLNLAMQTVVCEAA